MKSITCRNLKYEQGYSMTDCLRIIGSKNVSYLTSIHECNPFIRLNCILLPPKAGTQGESISSQSFFCNLSCVSTQWQTCSSWQWQHSWADSTRRALRFVDMHSAYVGVPLSGIIPVFEHSHGRDLLSRLQLPINATWAAVAAPVFACAGTTVRDEKHFQFIWVTNITN